MKLSLVVLIALVLAMSVTAVSAGQQQFNYQVPVSWNLIALPGIPLDPDPEVVLDGFPIDYNLYRFEAPIQSSVVYDEFDPDVFKGMLLTDGYWLNNVTGQAKTLSYQGLNDNDSMDIWISLPKAGWTLIGCPYSFAFLWENAKVTDGNQTVTLEQAAYVLGWMSSVGYGFNGTSQASFDIGIGDDFPTETHLEPWHGYWVQSYVDKLALIIEAPTP